MAFKVVFAPEAQEQLIALYRYVADVASPQIAAHFTDAIITYCEGLKVFPLRGAPRDDIRPGLRVSNYRKRTLIAFDVEGDTVSILGVFHGGQDFESALREGEASLAGE
jgi:plasmid stabilization system protein ParE